MKKIVLLLMFINILVASKLEVIDGNVTVNIGESERLLPIGTKIELDKNVTVCYLSGEGKVVIDDMSRSATSKDKCYTTQKKKKFNLKNIIASYLQKTVLRLFQKSKDTNSCTLFRGGEKESISEVVTLKAGEEHLIVESEDWSDYPITLTIYNAQNVEIKHFTKYIDDYDQTMVFDLNRKDLINGGHIKVQDKDGYEYINVRVELK